MVSVRIVDVASAEVVSDEEGLFVEDSVDVVSTDVVSIVKASLDVASVVAASVVAASVVAASVVVGSADEGSADVVVGTGAGRAMARSFPLNDLVP